MVNQDQLACFKHLKVEDLQQALQSSQRKQTATLLSLPAHIIRKIVSYHLPLADTLTAFVEVSYEWTEHDATSMMQDSCQHWAVTSTGFLQKKAVGQKANVDQNSPLDDSIGHLDPGIGRIADEHLHNRPVVIVMNEMGLSKKLAYVPENPERFKREDQMKQNRGENTKGKKAAVAVMDFQKYHDTKYPDPEIKKTFFFWNEMLPDLDISRIHHLHFKFGDSKFDWYWKWLPRVMLAFCKQKLIDDNPPKQLLLEFEDRQHKHKIQPNGKYVNDVLQTPEAGFRYADSQYKDYERTLKFMEPYLQKLAGRVRISLPYWMANHRYSHRIPKRFGSDAGNDIIFRPFAQDKRYVREWCTGNPLPRPAPLGQTPQPSMSALDFQYNSAEESDVNDDVEVDLEDDKEDEYEAQKTAIERDEASDKEGSSSDDSEEDPDDEQDTSDDEDEDDSDSDSDSDSEDKDDGERKDDENLGGKDGIGGAAPPEYPVNGSSNGTIQDRVSEGGKEDKGDGARKDDVKKQDKVDQDANYQADGEGDGSVRGQAKKLSGKKTGSSTAGVSVVSPAGDYDPASQLEGASSMPVDASDFADTSSPFAFREQPVEVSSSVPMAGSSQRKNAPRGAKKTLNKSTRKGR